MKTRIEFHAEKCTACGACVVACMDLNDIDVERGQRPYRRVFSWERGGKFGSVSVACLHCPDAPCAEACPVGCLWRDPDSGLVRFDNGACVGCRACAAVCPFDALSFRPPEEERDTEKMEKCHGCPDRIEAGLLPVCVAACPSGALELAGTEGDAPSPLAALYGRLRDAAGFE